MKVIAGDDVTKVVADHAGEIRDLRRVEVYYSALATREMRRDSPTPPTAFVYGLLGGKYPNASEDNLILTYDAAGVFCQAANTAYRSGGLPSKGDSSTSSPARQRARPGTVRAVWSTSPAPSGTTRSTSRSPS